MLQCSSDSDDKEKSISLRYILPWHIYHIINVLKFYFQERNCNMRCFSRFESKILFRKS